MPNAHVINGVQAWDPHYSGTPAERQRLGPAAGGKGVHLEDSQLYEMA